MNAAGRFYQNLKFNITGHVLNPLWWPRLKRRDRRGLCSYRRAEAYLKQFLPMVKAIVPEPMPAPDRADERIFSIWFQGEENAPRLVKSCMERLRKVYGDKYVVLDGNTLFEWIQLPDFIVRKWKEGKITHAHFSDICRVELLYRYGGMWFDSTDFLTSRPPERVEDADMFIFHAGKVVTPQSQIQSCFMRAIKGHPVFGAWRKLIFAYWEKENHVAEYFLLHYMLRFLLENNPAIAEIYSQMPEVEQDPTHRLWFGHLNDPYTPEAYRKLTEDTFFQKTTFKFKEARNPVPGSMAEAIVNNIPPLF